MEPLKNIWLALFWVSACGDNYTANLASANKNIPLTIGSNSQDENLRKTPRYKTCKILYNYYHIDLNERQTKFANEKIFKVCATSFETCSANDLDIHIKLRATFNIEDYEKALSIDCYQSFKNFLIEFPVLFNKSREEAKRIS